MDFHNSWNFSWSVAILFFLTPIVILSYFIFIKKILTKENLKDSFFAGWSFWNWFLYWLNALDNFSFFNL